MWEDHLVTLGGGRSLHARQSGAGRDVVLIHGALTTSHDWRECPVADELADTCRVTAIDRPGHGDSRRPRFRGTPRDQADQIAAGLVRLGIEHPVLVAHSFGALVALAFAERHPDSLTHLVLVAPIAFPEPRPLEHMLLLPRAAPLIGPFMSWLGEASRIDRAFAPLIHRLMFAPNPVPARWKERYPYAKILSAEALVFEGEDAAAVLPGSPAGTIGFASIRVPIDIFTGSSDRIVEDERQAKALGRLLPGARITEIEGAGHMLHHTHPAAIVSAVRKALRER